jgi:uncharacterized integral membrane protein
MIRWINILILISVLVAACILASGGETVSGFDPLFWRAAIPLTMSSFLSIFFGALFGISHVAAYWLPPAWASSWLRTTRPFNSYGFAE